MEQWLGAVREQLERKEAPQGFVRGWDLVAREYETIYAQID